MNISQREIDKAINTCKFSNGFTVIGTVTTVERNNNKNAIIRLRLDDHPNTVIGFHIAEQSAQPWITEHLENGTRLIISGIRYQEQGFTLQRLATPERTYLV